MDLRRLAGLRGVERGNYPLVGDIGWIWLLKRFRRAVAGVIMHLAMGWMRGLLNGGSDP